MQTLNNAQIRHLKSLAHPLKPVVIIGEKGVSEAVLQEIENALAAHELIKVKIRAEERADREQMIEAICAATGAAKVQRVGHILTLFKRSKEAKIALPR